MGWGGFLAGAGGAAAEIADKWITDEMEAIRARRVEEAAMRKEQREWGREDAQYERKREDTLEDYESKKKIDAKYRQSLGGGGSKKDGYLYMTMEDGSTRLVKEQDLDKMYSKGGELGMTIADTEGNEKFVRGTLGSKSKGTSSSANTLKDARLIAEGIADQYEGIPFEEWDPQDQDDYQLARQHMRAGLGGRGEPREPKPVGGEQQRGSVGALSYKEGAEAKSRGMEAVQRLQEGQSVSITLESGKTMTLQKKNGRPFVLSIQ